MKKLAKQVFTFGMGQAHAGKYFVIKAKTKEKCSERMFELFGDKWSMQYDSEEEAGVKRFGLKELK